MEYTIASIADKLGARVQGDASGVIKGVSGIESASSDTITFAANEKSLKKLKEDVVCGAVLVSAPVEGFEGVQIIVDNVNKALIRVLDLFAPQQERIEGIDSEAKISPTAKIASSAAIASGAVISGHVEIGPGTIISSGCKIGSNVKIGSNCRIDPNVVIYRDCVIGNNVIIQANTVVGSTGFGYSFIEGSHRLIPHNGGVLIEDHVDIGACCCIDRGKFANTVIGAGTKLDNLVQVAHNVVIGKCCLIAGQVGIAGSTVLGDGVVIAGQVGLCDNIKIGSGVQIGAKAGVMNSVEEGRKIVGIPAQDFSDEIKKVVLLKKLPFVLKEIKSLKQRLNALEAAEDNKN